MNGITSSMDMSLSKLQELVMEGNLACCGSWDRKELDTTEQLNRTVVSLAGFGIRVMLGL